MQGWECPKCGRVYAPWVASCTKCAAVPAPLPRTPRDPRYPDPFTPPVIPPRYGTGDFPEFEPRITCRDDMPEDTIAFVSSGDLAFLTNLG